MMRIAIAGGGGFAHILAVEVAQTANAVLVLSTRAHPELEQLGVQVAVVDYSNIDELQYTLQGVDLVISTISGASQLNLIDAARRARIRSFVPSEFEGALARRPVANDPLDRGSEAALGILRYWSRSNRMQFTVFSCGVFYERFAAGGLESINIGAGSDLGHPGGFLMNADAGTAEISELNGQGQPIMVSMTSVYDVARFVAAAIEIGPECWPREFRMRGDQLSVRDIVAACSTVRGIDFDWIIHEYRDIQVHLDYAASIGDVNRWYYFQRLLSTANGRYTFETANLNEVVNQTEGVDVTPERFVDWLRRVWGQSRPQLQPQPQQHSNAMEIE